MLQIHLMQQWYDLRDPAMEDALIEVPTMRRFARINLISDRIPDVTSILSFRHLLGKHSLGKQPFQTVKAHLKEQRILIKQGTIIDATYRSSQFHQEQQGPEGFRDAPDQEGEPMVFRDEGSYRRGQELRAHPIDRNDLCQRA